MERDKEKDFSDFSEQMLICFSLGLSQLVVGTADNSSAWKRSRDVS